jgi:MraZ protein
LGIGGPLKPSKGAGVERFRGGFPATIDAKGRVKLPARLREQLETSFGREVYICSFFPHELRIYPLQVWEGVEERLVAKPTMKPAVRKLIERVNYGQQQEMDDHGRMLVPALLREMVEVEGEVVVSGRINHLAVTNRDRAASFLTEEILSDDEQHELAELEL